MKTKMLAFCAYACMSATALADVIFPSGETFIGDDRSYTHAADGALVIEKDAMLDITGSVGYNASDVVSADVPVMSMTTGSVLRVSQGGSLTFTDLAGALDVNGSAQSPAKILVEGGEFKLAATRHSGMHLLGYLTLGEHSLLEVSGSGIFEMSAIAGDNPRFAIMRNQGGTILFKDNAQFKLGDVCNTSTLFSNGYVEFSGNSVLDYCSGVNSALGGIQIGTSTASTSMTTKVVFKGNASTSQINFGYPNAVRMANPKKGTWSTLSLQSKGTVGLGALTQVGVASADSSWKGGATLEVCDGYVQTGGNYGLIVGHVADGTTQFCTGIVNVAGGAYTVRAVQGGNAEANKAFCGTLIGRGPAIAGDGIYADATLNVSGGVFTNQIAYFVVGTGRSVGRVVQTGGEIRSTPVFKRPLVVGFAGGNGAFTVSNGVTTASSDVYVGGAPLDALGKTAADTDFRKSTRDGSGYAEDYTRGGAVGKLTVASADTSKECTFTALSTRASEGKLYVGQNGSGEVEIGEGGELIVNGAEFAGTSSALRCRLGASGAGTFEIKGALTVGEGARLVVDASAYAGKRSWVQLVKCLSRTGSFSVSFEGDSRGMEIVQNRPGHEDGSVWLYAKRGLTVSVK